MIEQDNKVEFVNMCWRAAILDSYKEYISSVGSKLCLTEYSSYVHMVSYARMQKVPFCY